MTDQRELDRALRGFFVEGINELPDRVVDAALDEIGRTAQRRTWHWPRSFPTMTPPARLAAVALVGTLAVAGTLYLIRPIQAPTGAPSPLPAATASPAATPNPQATATSSAPASFSIAAGRWVATPNMTQSHGGHTATLLADGRVLIAGGRSFSESFGSAEVFDPVMLAPHTWTPTGPMVEGHSGHTATLLLDGTVLVAGGGAVNGASAEVFDPATGSWRATGSMIVGRSGHTATRLQDGRVLVVGGLGGGLGAGLATAEVYDPATGTWTATSSMAAGRIGHTATLLPDGQVLVTGGHTANTAVREDAFGSAELYQPASGSWTTISTMLEARAFHTATLLRDGRVLVAGGHNGGGLHSDALASAELYDPARGTWTATGDMLEADAYKAAVLLLDGRVLLAGGYESDIGSGPPYAAELYDPVSGRWTEAGPMGADRTAPTATLLNDGTVLVAGGTITGTPIPTAELYVPTAGH